MRWQKVRGLQFCESNGLEKGVKATGGKFCGQSLKVGKAEGGRVWEGRALLGQNLRWKPLVYGGGTLGVRPCGFPNFSKCMTRQTCTGL
jgi:hypothetical protein